MSHQGLFLMTLFYILFTDHIILLICISSNVYCLLDSMDDAY